MGMEKLGTKDRFYYTYYNENKVLFEINFRNLDPYKFWILKNYKEFKGKNFFDEVETPRGAPKALISPKLDRISPFTCCFCKK
jgi:hypothetical protein